jgi:hypothetical protein
VIPGQKEVRHGHARDDEELETRWWEQTAHGRTDRWSSESADDSDHGAKEHARWGQEAALMLVAICFYFHHVLMI